MHITSTKHAAHRGLNILVYGAAGAGKTTLLGTTADPEGTVILSAEAGLLPLRHLDLRVIEVDSLATLHEALAYVQRPDAAVRWVCVDSLSEIAERVLASEKRRTKDPRAAYGEMADGITHAVKALRDLRGINVVLVAKRGVIEDGARPRGCLLMPGKKLQESLPYELDIVSELRVAKDEAGAVVRWLQTEADGWGDAKDRSGSLAASEPPDLAALAAKVKATIPAQAAAAPPAAGPPASASPAKVNGDRSIRDRITAGIDWLSARGQMHVADEIHAMVAPGVAFESLTEAQAVAYLREIGRVSREIQAQERAAAGAPL